MNYSLCRLPYYAHKTLEELAVLENHLIYLYSQAKIHKVELKCNMVSLFDLLHV